jgi:hypothetical protein
MTAQDPAEDMERSHAVQDFASQMGEAVWPLLMGRPVMFAAQATLVLAARIAVMTIRSDAPDDAVEVVVEDLGTHFMALVMAYRRDLQENPAEPEESLQ